MIGARTKNELRCFCSRRPLLATYGLSKEGQIYVHVRIFKQRRIFGEVIATGGTVHLHCRECLRWHAVRIVQPHEAVLEEGTDPRPEEPEVTEPPTLARPAPEHLR